jgi:acyl-CoA reductase-like NAD-dependent aldehyde dehydrogenase
MSDQHERVLHHIDGAWVPSASGRALDNTNPADTRQILGTVVDGDRADTLRAIEAAHAAAPGWRRTPSPKRGDLLLATMRIMEERKQAIARALTAGGGQDAQRVLGEVQRHQRARVHGRRVAAPERRDHPVGDAADFAYTVRAPLGVVGIITPWNFPVCIPVWKIAPALVAGNTVVFKPSPITPWTAKLTVECFLDAACPRAC